jgi:hypothetical protein
VYCEVGVGNTERKMAEKCHPGQISCAVGSYVNFSSYSRVLSSCAKMPKAGTWGGDVSKSLQVFGPTLDLAGAGSNATNIFIATALNNASGTESVL